MPKIRTNQPVIKKVAYNSFSVESISDSKLSEKEKKYLLNYPLYILYKIAKKKKQNLIQSMLAKLLTLTDVQNNI